MNIIKNIVFLVFIIVVFSSCSNRNDNSKNDLSYFMELENETSKRKGLELKKVKEISFPVDSTSRNFSIYSAFYEDVETGRNLFVNRNEFTNGIDFYNMETKEMENRITLEKEGSEGMKVMGMFVMSLDSIYIFSRKENKMFLVDYSGKIKKKYKFPESVHMSLISTIFSKFHVEGNNAFFQYIPMYKMENNTDSSTAIKINLKDNSFEKIEPKFPAYITESNFKSKTPAVNKGKGSVIISRFRMEPIVRIYDYDRDSTYYKVVRSKYHKMQITPQQEGTPDMHEYMKAAYYPTIYDKYRDVYYSMFSHDTEAKDENGMLNSFDDKEMSIIVSDGEFKHITELKLESDTYFRSFFVAKEGLMISTANANNKNEKEESINYHLFELKKI